MGNSRMFYLALPLLILAATQRCSAEETGNGTVIGTGNGTVIGTGNGTVIGTGNGTVIGTGNGTVNGTQLCVQQPHQQEINALVQEFNSSRNWYRLVDALDALVDASSELHRQLQRLSYGTSTPFFLFGQRGHTELASLLLCAGLNASTPDAVGEGIWSDGRTMLHGAALKGRLQLVKLLLDHGADINAQNIHGSTPLMDAVFGRHLNVVQELVQAGANTTLRNNQGRTALGMPTSRKVSQYLEQFPH